MSRRVSSAGLIRFHAGRLEPPAGLAGKELAGWLGVKPDTVTITRDSQEITLTGGSTRPVEVPGYMQDYLATIQSVDDNVGRVLGYLEKSGLAQNTIIIYTSDQGFFLGDHRMYV